MSKEEMSIESLEGDQVIEMDINRLRDFKNHPFKVTADISMVELKESIQKFGILNPLIVRPVIEGYYEIISGHRRRYAAKQLGYTKVPVIIKVMRTDEAIVAMVDSNLQREFITPSEKARAYKMKYDVLRKKKNVNCCGRVVHKTKGKRTVEILAEQYGESAKQIQRYLKLNDLIPDLLAKVDDDELSFSAAIEIAFLKEEEQQWFLEAMTFAQSTPSLSQAQRIKRLSQEKKLTKDEIKDILSEIKREDVSRVTFKTEQLRRFFPKGYSIEMMKREIIDILKIWMEKYWDE